MNPGNQTQELSWIPGFPRGPIGLALIAAASVACGGGTRSERMLEDGGAFVIPDSGWFFDASTPRFTDATRPRRWRLQLTSSLHELQIPTIGRPAKASAEKPSDRR